MNCLECQDLLQLQLDGVQLPASAGIDQHLAGCQSCRLTHAAGLLMLEGLKALPPAPELPADFSRLLVGNILRDRQHRRARMRQRVWVTAGLAAAILIMVWAGNIWLPNRPVVVEHPKQPEQPNSSPLVQKKDPDVEKPSLLPPPHPKHKVEAPNDVLAQTFDPAAQSVLQAGQGVSEGLHTVSRNAQRAVSFFMRELPVLDSAD